LLDQKVLWTRPLHLRLNDSFWAVPFGIVTGSLIAADPSIEKELPDSPNTINRFQSLSNAGVAAFGGLSAGSYLLGRLKHNAYLGDTGFLAGEAAVGTLLPNYALKLSTRRDRPNEGNGRGDFFAGGLSFSSEHAAMAWSMATVFAERYPGWLTKILMYGGASAVAASRVGGRNHFVSDVFVGSALGWYTGHQVVKRHMSSDDDRAYGTFVSSPESASIHPGNMGSTYVPLDSWIYPVLDRWAALGYVQSAFLGIRPWTRMECARLVLEAKDGMQSRTDGDSDLGVLEEEFSREIARMEAGRNVGAEVESVYTRVTGITGQPLNDSYHFGQTIYNDYGRPYQEGFNALAGVSGRAVAGPWALYVRGEYQHAPWAEAPIESARIATAEADTLPVPPATPIAEVNKFRLVDAYVSFTVSNWQLSFGKQSTWWGPGQGGALMFTNNAESLYMVRLDRVSPFRLPSFLGLLGPIRAQMFFGRLQGHRFIDLRPVTNTVIGSWDSFVSPQPFIHATKFTLKPTKNLEIGVSLGAEFAGEGVPLTFYSLRRTFNNYSTGTYNNGNRETGFHFSYRVPGLRDWLTLYADSMAEDEPNPIAYPRRSAMNPGIYLSRVPRIPKLDLRVEGVYTNVPNLEDVGVYYRDYHFRQGWTNNSNIMGSWIGRQANGIQAWSTYWLSGRNKVQVGFRNSTLAQGFVRGGGYRDFSAKTELFLRKDVSLVGMVQEESWRLPALSPNVERNLATTVQVTFWPGTFKGK
jgi:membrane-associated phospholipid phosphatase